MRGSKGWGVRMLMTPRLWRPSLVLEAFRAALSTRGKRRDREAYWAWRVQTAYGSADAEVPVEDMIAYLRWRRLQRRSAG